MPEPPPYISANTSITEELLSEFTKPARIDGLAAGRITFMNRFTPVSSNVAALSNSRLSMVMIPVIVANNVAQTILYTTKNMEADNNVGDSNSTNGDNKADNNSCYL